MIAKEVISPKGGQTLRRLADRKKENSAKA